MTFFSQIAKLLLIIYLALLSSVLIIDFFYTRNALQSQVDLYSKHSMIAIKEAITYSSPDRYEDIAKRYFKLDSFSLIAISNQENKSYVHLSKDLNEFPTMTKIFAINTPEVSTTVTKENESVIIRIKACNCPFRSELTNYIKRTIFWFVLISTLGLLILFYKLHLLFKPLKVIQSQAENILEHKFAPIEYQATTVEFNEVIEAMNTMISKVEDIFNTNAQMFHNNLDLLYIDEMTKLHNRRYLSIRLEEVLSSESEQDDGHLIFITLHGVGNANVQYGRETVNEMLKSFANRLSALKQHGSIMIIARISGTEFAILLPSSSEDDLESFRQKINTIVKSVMDDYNLDSEEYGNSLGAAGYCHGDNPSKILEHANEALSIASTKPFGHLEIIASCNRSDEVDWAALFDDVIKEKTLIISTRQTYNADMNKLRHEVLSFSLQYKNRIFNYGQFIAQAIHLNRVSELYHILLSKLFHNEIKIDTDELAIRLSAKYLHDDESFSQLYAFLSTYAGEVPYRLVFEIPDRYIAEDREKAYQFTEMFNRYGFGVGIHNFIGLNEDFEYLKSMHPVYLKVDTKFLLETLENHLENAVALPTLMRTYDIELIATGVNRKDELEMLSNLHIHTFQGAYVEKVI